MNELLAPRRQRLAPSFREQSPRESLPIMNHQGQVKRNLANTVGSRKPASSLFQQVHGSVLQVQIITMGGSVLPKKPMTSPISQAPLVGILPPGEALQSQKF